MAPIRWILGTVLVIATMGAASATAPDPAETIAGRQAAFRLSGAVFGAMKGAMDRGDDVTGLAGGAGALAAWGKALPGLFPAGSQTAASRALPAVWSDRAGFEKAAADYVAAAGALGIAAKAGDKATVITQFAAVRASCAACHDHYRQPERY